MIVYMIRHQAGGTLPEYLFAERPTETQLEPIRELLRARHGDKHPKTKQTYWLQVIEVVVMGRADIPRVELPGVPAGPAIGPAKISAVGGVKNPK